MPCAGNGSRVPCDNANIEPSDVNSQLQGIGGNHAQHLSLLETLLDFPPGHGKISPAVPSDDIPIPLFPFYTVFQVFGENLHVEPTGGKDDGLNSPIDKWGGEVPCGADMASTDTQFLVDYGRIVKEEELLR